MMRKLFSLGLLLIFTSGLLSAVGFADSIPVGFIDYNASQTGAAEFDISNQTGPNSTTSPDSTFPVTNSISLLSLSLTVDFKNGTSQTFGSSYFTLAPDGLSLTGNLLSPTAVSALLTGSFSNTTFQLNDGSSVSVLQGFSASLNDPLGSLQDQDFAIINGTTARANVPEPGMWTLLWVTLAGLMMVRFNRLLIVLSGLFRKRGIANLLLAVCVTMVVSVSQRSMASTVVKLNSWTLPSSGATGAAVSVTGSGFPAGPISPAAVHISLALSCGGGATSAAVLKVNHILGTTDRISFQIPAALAAGNYFLSISGTTSTGGSFASGNCSEISVLHTYAYVANNFSNSVSVIDTATKSVIANVVVGSVPTELAISLNQKYVIVTNQTAGSVSIISTATNSVVATVPVGSGPVGAAVGPNGLAYVTLAGENNLAIIDLSTFGVIAKIGVGPAPVRVTVTPDGSLAYVSNQNSNFISVVDTSTNTVVNTIVVGPGPYGLKFSPDGARAYDAVLQANSLAVIDTTTLSVIASIGVGVFPTDVAISSDGTLVYVNNQFSNSVSVIKTSTNTVIATVPVGAKPSGIAISPNQKFVYVSNNGSNTESIIDTSSNTVTGSVAVGSNPVGVIIANVP